MANSAIPADPAEKRPVSTELCCKCRSEAHDARAQKTYQSPESWPSWILFPGLNFLSAATLSECWARGQDGASKQIYSELAAGHFDGKFFL